MHESGEMYLETILVLSKEKEFVRSIDISENMGYSKPSVSRAVGLLKKDGHIAVDGKGYITLTDSGKKIAQTILDRHEILTNTLKAIGVCEETASRDACKIEHNISEETFEAIKRAYKQVSGVSGQ